MRKTASLTWGPRGGGGRNKVRFGPFVAPTQPCVLLLSSLHKEEMEFQPGPGEAGEEGAHAGILGRLLGLQPPHAPTRTSSKTKLLLPRKEGLLPEGQPEPLRGARKRSGDPEDSEACKLSGEDAFKPPALYGRSGYHSAPPTPLSPTPMVFPPGPWAPSSLRRGSGVLADQSPQPGARGTRRSLALLPECAGASMEPLELCHIKRKTVEFNLTDTSAAPESHLREPHTRSTSSIHTALTDHGPYWALESRSVLPANQAHRTPSLGALQPHPSSPCSEPTLPPWFPRGPITAEQAGPVPAPAWGTHLATWAGALGKRWGLLFISPESLASPGGSPCLGGGEAAAVLTGTLGRATRPGFDGRCYPWVQLAWKAWETQNAMGQSWGL